jgi:hypothetical protein
LRERLKLAEATASLAVNKRMGRNPKAALDWRRMAKAVRDELDRRRR